MKASIKQMGIRSVSSLAAIAALAACGASSDITGTAKQAVAISFSTRTASATGTQLSAGARADLVLGQTGELVITRIQLVLNRLELTRTDAASCVSTDSTQDDRVNHEGEAEGDGCENVSASPMVVDIPLDAAVHTALNVPLSAGTYTKLEARLAPSASVGATDTTLAGRSVRVTGTFNGKAFTFTSALRSKIEMEFSPPLVIDATTKNATVNIDVSSWFKSSGGALIDPSTANPGGANAATVSANIRASFRAFKDDDKGGDNDHGHHGGSGNH